MPKSVKVVMLFNGTGNSDHDPDLTNVVKMRDGLIHDATQIVAYHNGIGNSVDWTDAPFRWFAEATGVGGEWVMKDAYNKSLLREIKKAIHEGKIKNKDTLEVSVGGFSRGAFLARHFIHAYVNSKLSADLKSQTGLDLKIKVEAEYLFDTVGSFYIPLDIPILKWFGIHTQQLDPGLDPSIPDGVKSYHLCAIDERRTPTFAPTLISYRKIVKEVWEAGDHSSVGGGHPAPADGEMNNDANTLRQMAQWAYANGLRFKPEFLQKHKITTRTPQPLGYIYRPTYDELPPDQRGPRDIVVVGDQNKPTNILPIIAQSVIVRMHQDKTYRPEALKNLEQFRVFREQDEKVFDLSPEEVESLWQSLDTPATSKAAVRSKTLLFTKLGLVTEKVTEEKEVAEPKKRKARKGAAV